jgi:long-subunit fatty acid transport protein
VNYKSFGALVRFLPALAYQVTDRLSIGGTLGVAASHAEIEGPFYPQSGPLLGVPTTFDMQASGAALTWSAGLQYQLTDSTTIGAAYNSANKFKLDGNAIVDIGGSLGGPPPARFDADAEITWPQTVGLGLQHRFGPCRRLGLDLVWYDWSSAFDSLDVTLTDAAGNQIVDSFPLRWRDSLSVRTGYEQMLSTSTIVRAGYIYHRNPVPAGTLTPYIPGILEHAFTVGYGKRWTDHALNFAYMYSFGPSQSVGASDIAGGDFDNSRIDAAAHWVSITFIRAW